jgi:hypothetical protein
MPLTEIAGASGALYALVACTAMLQPEARFGLILLPGLSFPAWQALAVAMGVDVAGLLLGWKMFDHGAHLVRAWTPAAVAVTPCWQILAQGLKLGLRLGESVAQGWDVIWISAVRSSWHHAPHPPPPPDVFPS